MNFKLYVDPGELKRGSRFVKCKNVAQLKPITLPGLEEMTGADILISPAGLPKPGNEFLFKIHLDNGALLVQLKFGFDLVASILDNRVKFSQAKMLATGAHYTQIILLFIGLVFEPEDEKSELMINGKYARNVVPQAKNLKFAHYLQQRQKWAQRGGVFEHITLENSLKMWIESTAKVTFENIESKQVWEPKQELFLVNDWRNLLPRFPGLGEKKAQEIYNWLDDKTFYGFLAAIENGELKNVPGIGSGIIEKIKKYLKGEK